MSAVALKHKVVATKALQEKLSSKLEQLERKRVELFHTGKIGLDLFGRIGSLTQPMLDIIRERRIFESDLDEIARDVGVVSVTPYFAIDEVLRSRDFTDLLSLLKDLGFSLNTLFEKPLPSVEIEKGSDEDQPSSKAIDNLLYSYTPFKLRGRDRYSILLVPSVRGDNITQKWHNEGASEFYENGVRIVTPDSVKLTNVSQLAQKITVKGEQNFKFEIDRRSPRSTYFCRMGYYVSPDPRCNYRECWLWDPCQGTKFWKGPRPLYGVGRVVPDLTVKVERHDDVVPVHKSSNGTITLERIENMYARIYINSVAFLSSFFTHTPIINLKEAPGYRIRTRAISLAVDAIWLKKFVEELLKRDKELFSWILTKQFVFENYDVNDLRRVARFFLNIIESREDEKSRRYSRALDAHELDDDLVSFACRLVMHSFAHLFHQEIISDLQTASENFLYYYTPEPRDGIYRVYLIENAERGLGLTESFVATAQKSANYLQELSDRLINMISFCSRAQVSSFSTGGAPTPVTTIWNRLNDYNRIYQTTLGISIPIEFARYILSREDQQTAKLVDREDVAPYMDDILSAAPLCWDGCYHCVRLETDCHDSPYEQIFLVSKQLLLALLNEWRGTFRNLGGKAVQQAGAVVQIGEARNLFNYVRQATRSVYITSPWISKEVASSICDIAASRKIPVRILTSMDDKVDTHVKALKTFLSRKVPNLEVRVLIGKMLHAKMVIVDDATLVIGSANLTLSGLYENIEGYVMLSGKDSIRDSLSKFMEIWDNATPLAEAL